MEGAAEVSAVYGGVAGGFWVVEVFAAGAVEFYGGEVCGVVLACGEEGLACAEDAGAFAEFGFFEFVELGIQALVSNRKVRLGRNGHTIFWRPRVVTI